MREKFNKYKKGDRLGAKHVNRTSRVARRLAARGPASFSYGTGTTSDFSAGIQPFVQHIVRVVSTTEVDQIYNVKVRYYNRDTNAWTTSPEKYKMDARDLDLTFEVNDKVVAFYHEQSNYFIPICCGDVTTTATTSLTSKIEFLTFCGNEANECCMFEGAIYRIDPDTPDFCPPKICMIPVWLYCRNTEAGDTWPMNTTWCDFGKLVKSDFDCNGDTRDVYLIDCGDCGCQCPGRYITATVQAFDCHSDLEFTMTAVSQDPMDVLEGSPGWWGEFEFTGYYPITAMQIPVIPFDWGAILDIQEVYITFGCNDTAYNTHDDLCTAGKVYVLVGSSFVEYTGAYTYDTGGAGPLEVPIEEEINGNPCQLFCERTFKYGVYVSCNTNPISGGNLIGGKIYHLWPEGSIHRVIDPYVGLSVPSPEEYFQDGDQIAFPGKGCCIYSETGEIDPVLGNTIKVENQISCTTLMPNESTNAVLYDLDPIKYHTFGGCKATLSLYEPSLNICDDGTGVSIIRIVFDWSGETTCKEGTA